jgi:small subunit ribosomal protein S33
MIQYYPPVLSIKELSKAFPNLELADPVEKQRLKDVAAKKARSKGPPKKTKAKGMSTC